MWMALVLSLSPWGHAAASVSAQRRDAPERAQPALASEIEEAGAAFAEGVEAYKEGRFEDALVQFSRAQELAPHPDTLFNLALAQQRTEHHVDAWHSFATLLEQASDEQEREDISSAQAASRAHVAWVRVIAEPESSLVCLDGEPLTTDAVGQRARLTTPGVHRIDVDRQRRMLELEGGESRTVELVGTPSAPPPRGLRALAGVGIGGAGAAVGLGLGAAFVDDGPARLGLGVGAAAASTVALTSTVIALVIHRRARHRESPAPLDRCPAP